MLVSVLRPVHVILAYQVPLEPTAAVALAVRLRDLGRRCGDITETRAWVLPGQLTVAATVLATARGEAVGKVESAAAEAAGDQRLGIADVLECKPVI